jgi:hypothetical protein
MEHHIIFLGLFIFLNLVAINERVYDFAFFINGEKGVKDETADLKCGIVGVAKSGVELVHRFGEIKGDLCALDVFAVDLSVVAGGQKTETADNAEK